MEDLLTIGAGLLPEHGAVLLGEGGAESAVPGVKSLLLEDFCIFCVENLATCGGCETRSNKLKHEEI